MRVADARLADFEKSLQSWTSLCFDLPWVPFVHADEHERYERPNEHKVFFLDNEQLWEPILTKQECRHKIFPLEKKKESWCQSPKVDEKYITNMDENSYLVSVKDSDNPWPGTWCSAASSRYAHHVRRRGKVRVGHRRITAVLPGDVCAITETDPSRYIVGHISIMCRQAVQNPRGRLNMLIHDIVRTRGGRRQSLKVFRIKFATGHKMGQSASTLTMSDVMMARTAFEIAISLILDDFVAACWRNDTPPSNKTWQDICKSVSSEIDGVIAKIFVLLVSYFVILNNNEVKYSTYPKLN